MTNPLDEITAELRIRSLVARYSDGVNRRDAAAWGDTWAKAGCWKILGKTVTGREEIVAHWAGLMDTLDFVLQQTTCGLVEFPPPAGTEASATGRWYIHEISKRPGRDSTLFGCYHDTYVHEDGAWRFSERRLDIIFASPQELPGKVFPFPADPGGS